ncbi:cyclic dehypoxanthinyl futalosine synthase [Effusibacillus lacus]|uniref:Cyclic dehypoxanthine futalosine synthase n=1 Tax=Effusibacillus lacus TaxID=1348429 RepID=A0A292YMJ9_9BACL|nr:cyclic dehypoxanthinyl futalosine synthase [Effusibacillus lacus]TCS75287.1 de-hypoxanthine futalosine cyclase [Effusibacillus lacus]GAX89725.1 dehypoxanthine futalosine cyclase [Effusibacillus lacus]
MSIARVDSVKVDSILDKALSGERLTLEDGLALYESHDLIKLGAAAKQVTKRLHPDNIVTFTVNRNINYTNVCDTYCRFCAFYRPEGHPEAYVLSDDVILDKIRETYEIGGDESEILMQGGTHPGLPLSYYTDLLRKIKAHFPTIIMHSFSAAEIWKMVEVSGLSLKEVIRQLKEAGLDSIPGGGAEILDDRTRMRISKLKESWTKWMEVHDTAHRLGMNTTATMVIGFGESHEERILHMLRVREQQDKTGGFTAFISWTYQPDNTALKGTRATAVEYLKNVAISRLMIDNIKNFQSSWVTMGPKIGQAALEFGCNDMGSTMIEENVVSAAGATHSMNIRELIRLIRDAGLTPARRNTYYKILETY